MRVVFVFKNMVEELTIARSHIDPEDLRGTTVGFQRLEKPGQIFVARFEEPLAIGSRGKVSIIRELYSQEGYVASWEAILQGGEDKYCGLRFEGIWAELKLRYSQSGRQDKPSITADDNKRYWGS